MDGKFYSVHSISGCLFFVFFFFFLLIFFYFFGNTIRSKEIEKVPFGRRSTRKGAESGKEREKLRKGK